MGIRKLGKITEKELKLLKQEHKTKFVSCEKGCGREVEIDFEAVSGICYICSTNMAPPDKLLLMSQEEKDEFRKNTIKFNLKGWHLYSQMVDKDGNVYQYGKEIPELKGQFEPTNIETIKKSKKKEKKSQREKNVQEIEEMEELAQRDKKKREEQRHKREEKKKKLEELSTNIE